MQNEDPNCIWFELHKEDKWLPLIRNSKIPHPRQKIEYEKFQTWLQHNRSTKNLEIIDYKIRGDFMKSF